MRLIELIKIGCEMEDGNGTCIIFEHETMEIHINYGGKLLGTWDIYLDEEIQAGIECLSEKLVEKKPELKDFSELELLLRYGMTLSYAG